MKEENEPAIIFAFIKRKEKKSYVKGSFSTSVFLITLLQHS